MGTADNWSLNYDGEEQGVPFTEIGQGVRLYDVRSRFSDAFGETRGEKIGYAIHHDATVMADEDKNFNGTTIDEELDRLGVIHRHHTVNNGWGGIGYHRVIGLSGRVYLTGSSNTQRAHVEALNHKWIGYCFMGDWSNGRPSEPAMHALRTALQWETDQRGVPMQMAPHKRLTPGTACPGGWADVTAWAGLTLTPSTPVPTVDVEAALRALGDAETAIRAARAALGG